MNLYPSAAPGRNATLTASTMNMRKNSGIMILLVFSMLCAPRYSVRSVPATTMMWYGTTDIGVDENSPNHAAVSAVMSVPTRESTSALRMYVTITAYPMAMHSEPASGSQPRMPPALPKPLPRVAHALSYVPRVPVRARLPMANSAGRPT